MTRPTSGLSEDTSQQANASDPRPVLRQPVQYLKNSGVTCSVGWRNSPVMRSLGADSPWRSPDERCWKYGAGRSIFDLLLRRRQFRHDRENAGETVALLNGAFAGGE